MSEENPHSSGDKPKYKPGYKTKLGLLEVIERKRLNFQVDYKAIAIRTGTSAGTLRNLYSRFLKGEIDMGEPVTAEEKRLDERVEHEKQLGLARRLRKNILDGFHGTIVNTEAAAGDTGDPMAYQKTGVMQIVKDLKLVNALINELEKGYMAILDEERASREASMKRAGVPGGPAMDVEAQVVNANDEQRALMALKGATPPPSE